MSSSGTSGSVTIDVTVRVPRRRAGGLDLRISAPAGTPLATVLPEVARATGVGGVGTVRCAGAPISPHHVLGSPPLLHGASLVADDRVAGAAAVAGTADDLRVDRTMTAPLDLVVVAGPDAGRRVPLSRDGVVVGRSAGLGLSLDDARLSRQHVRITAGDNGFRATDLDSTNGTRVGSALLTGGAEAEVSSGAMVTIGGSMLRLTRSVGTTAPVRPRGDGRVVVNRSPRTRPPQTPRTITVPAPPSPPTRGRIPWVAAALPLPFAGLLAFFFGPQMLAFALLSPLMLVGNVVGDRWGRRRDHRVECARHEAEVAEQRATFDALRDLEREERWVEAPDPATVLQIASGPGTRLWERRPGSADLGRVRLGVGPLPSRVGWASGGRPTEHPLLDDLPVEVDVGAVAGLGVAGPSADVTGLISHVVGQLATLHSPRDLRLVIHCRSDPSTRPTNSADEALSWARWLPHTTAYGGLESCLEAVHDVVTERTSDDPGSTALHRGESFPVVVVVLPHGVVGTGAGELLDLLERGREVGVWCVVGAGRPVELPAGCRAVVGLGQGGGDGLARLDVDGAEPVAAFRPDHVGWWWGERLARALAPLVDGSGAGQTLPDTVDLLELLGLHNLLPRVDHTGETGDSAGLDRPASPPAELVARRWSLGDGAPVATVGRRAGEDWVIDLAIDGPHILVGGTTGSGKSEFLRTLVTSLSLTCSPADLTFVLVDYKGGSAFGECAELPHTVGLVTNLDEGLASRALVSLTAEIERREGLLAASGARDFDDHRRRGGALARLVIVIDEFRLLADELPDFVDGVVSLAAVGRSLGVHLVLATQRPAGAITADIQANVNLRIAMRLRDTADSIDVIAAPDAARVPADRPGRGLARGGDGELVEFQAAHVGGGRAPAAATVVPLDGWGRPLESDRALPVGARIGPSPLGELAAASLTAWRQSGQASPHRPWLPPLSESLDTASLATPEVGMVDLPTQQRQEPFSHTGAGHWVLAGGPRSGRTTALRTIVAAHLAAGGSEAQAQIIDTSGALADLEPLPQIGAVVAGDDTTRLRRLIARLRTHLADSPRTTTPTLLCVDGWDRLDADLELGFGGIRDDLLDLLRSGGVGLRAVVTGDRSVLGSRLTALAEETFLLPLADPADATYAGLSRRDLPSSRAPGRALRLTDRAEVQFARCDPLAEVTPGTAPPAGLVTIPRLPERVDLAEILHAGGGASEASHSSICFGLSAETGTVAAWDLERHGRRMLVLGHPRSGRTSTLQTLATSLLASGHTIAIIGHRGGVLPLASAELVGGGQGRIGVGRGAPGSARLVHVDPWDAEPLIAMKREHPDLAVVIDDADALDGTPVEPVLEEIVGLVERDGGFVAAAATPSSINSRFRGPLTALARTQSGLLLSPRTPSDGEALGVRAPRGLATTPGRGLLVTGREVEEVQVALAQTPRSPVAASHGDQAGFDSDLMPAGPSKNQCPP